MSDQGTPSYQIFIQYPHAQHMIRTLRKKMGPTMYYDMVYLPEGMFFGFPNPTPEDTARIKLFLEVLNLPHKVLAER